MPFQVNDMPCHHKDGTPRSLDPLPLVVGLEFHVNLLVTGKDAEIGMIYFLEPDDGAPVIFNARNRNRSVKPEYEGRSLMKFFGVFHEPGTYDLFIHAMDARRITTITCNVLADKKEEKQPARDNTATSGDDDPNKTKKEDVSEIANNPSSKDKEKPTNDEDDDELETGKQMLSGGNSLIDQIDFSPLGVFKYGMAIAAVLTIIMLVFQICSVIDRATQNPTTLVSPFAVSIEGSAPTSEDGGHK